ncbi:hypothetical protein JTB14_004463 [Gonioctena quinquepunctata]|nr:hypothetical protein JTB14_004463 [Gonioctena quinquepunctata]
MPSKHITLGITLKSLTNSKKVLSLINKLGHCICYNVVEGLETEASYTSVGRSELYPSNVHLRDDLHTGVAFDNFDRFVETIDGKDTLHYTVGIIYQDVCEDVEQQNPADDTGRSRKRRRTFDTSIPDIQPFSKRLKSISGLLPVDFSSRSDIPSNLEEIKMIDAAWLISHVMVDSGLLAAGSVGGFLSAKNFNRAKRLHVLVSLALNMEHFKFFMASEDIEID